MVTYLLDFHKKIRFSKTLSEYQEQPYPLEKTTVLFLDPPKKMQVSFVGYSWNNQGIFLNSIYPEHYFEILHGISLGIFSEYTGNISWECFTNIPRTYICPVGNERRAKSNEQRAKSNKRRAKSNKQRAKNNEQRAKSNK